MPLPFVLAPDEIEAIFTCEVSSVGGRVVDRYSDGELLLLRSVLPAEREVQPGDRVQGGVALRADETDIFIHPYVFRQVCTNGAIRAHALQTVRIAQTDLSGDLDVELETAELLRQAILCCLADDAFAHSVAEMRSAHEQAADLALMLLPMLARLPEEMRGHYFRQIRARFVRAGDRSRFGLMNAVTSLARDTANPRERWRLEELGGGIPVGSLAPAPRRPMSVQRALQPVY